MIKEVGFKVEITKNSIRNIHPYYLLYPVRLNTYNTDKFVVSLLIQMALGHHYKLHCIATARAVRTHNQERVWIPNPAPTGVTTATAILRGEGYISTYYMINQLS